MNISINAIEPLSQFLGDMNTGSEITRYLAQSGFIDNNSNAYDEGRTKWKRLNNHFVYDFNNIENSQKIIKYLTIVFDPRKHINNEERFLKLLSDVNLILSMDGIEINQSGKVNLISKTNNIKEAKIKYTQLKEKLETLGIHPKILMFCKPDIVNKDYSSIIFESCKCLYDEIRLVSESEKDANSLIKEVFSTKTPVIAFNSLQTDNDKNEHYGLNSLLLAIGYLFRNPKAHTPKFFSVDNEQDCLLALQIISFALYRVKECFKCNY